MNSELELLKDRSVRRLDEIQKNCKHNWGILKLDTQAELDYNIRWINEKIFRQPAVRVINRKCWSVECKTCGYKQYFNIDEKSKAKSLIKKRKINAK